MTTAVARSYHLTAPNVVDTPRLARNHVAELLTLAGHGELVETARLLVSEAVTNVYQHTAVARLSIRTDIGSARVRVAVKDAAPRRWPAVNGLEPDAESGRGLALLDMLAAAWGVTYHGAPRPEAKTVWFELRSGGGC
ncbi:ATP-binding protein [Streptomyces millisiae]|uniref:ATP-binding protein n=1 Tax=Streptomyces millisiae TaxID=3075542 RepID=A0ABU2LVX2_9ACTN|nr:ATP-binding protein [Streptomyces sp. DSM 44918]MDT0321745.1 ATP-binding protein [Streptomyces sp. DSM 44918]